MLLHREHTYPAVAQLGRPVVLLTLAGVALVLQFATGTAVYFYGDLYGVLGLVLALLLAGLVTTSSSSAAWLSSRPTAFLAANSYTVYLIHGFFVNGVEMVVPEHWDRLGSVVSAALSLGLAVYASWTVHRAYEEPLCRYGVRLSRRIDERRAVRREAPAALESVPA